MGQVKLGRLTLCEEMSHIGLAAVDEKDFGEMSHFGLASSRPKIPKDKMVHACLDKGDVIFSRKKPHRSGWPYQGEMRGHCDI